MSNFNMNELNDQKAHTGSRSFPDSGDYNVLISKSELGPNNAKNGENVAMEYSILDGAFAGTEVPEWLSVVNNSKEAQDISRSKLKAIQIVTKSEGISNPSELTGKSMRIRLIKEPNQYIDKNGNQRDGFQMNVVNYMDMEGNNAEGKPVAAFVASDTPPVKKETSSGDTGGGSSEDQTSQSSKDLDDEIPF